MIKIILIAVVVILSAKIIYAALVQGASGPFSKQLQLLWSGEDCGSFGKIMVLALPAIIVGIIGWI